MFLDEPVETVNGYAFDGTFSREAVSTCLRIVALRACLVLPTVCSFDRTWDNGNNFAAIAVGTVAVNAVTLLRRLGFKRNRIIAAMLGLEIDKKLHCSYKCSFDIQ